MRVPCAILVCGIAVLGFVSASPTCVAQTVHIDPGRRGGLGIYAGPNGERGITYKFENGITLSFPMEKVGGRTNLSIAPYENDDIFGMQASGYIYNSWRDENGNGTEEIPNELIGRKNHTFYDSESLYLRVATKNIRTSNGSDVTVALLDPAGKVVFTDTVSPNTRYFTHWWNLGEKKWKERTLNKHGEGTYRAAFFVEGTCFTLISFNWYRAVSDMVCNFWEDFDNDGRVDFHKELVGREKRRFTADEKVTFFVRIRQNAKGKHARVKLLAPDGRTVIDSTEVMPYESSYWYLSRKVADTISTYGTGTYRTVWYVDGTHVGGKSFELVKN